MRRLNWGLITALLFCFAFWDTIIAHAQMVPSNRVQSSATRDSSKYITVYYGVLADAPRRMLDSLWSTDPNQVERGYCVGVVSYNSNWAYEDNEKLGREITARVWSIYPARVDDARPSSVGLLTCDEGDPQLHTHPPTTCDDDDTNCVKGGVNAWQCQASRTDYMTLIRKRHRFAIVQCDRNAFRFYWPSEYRP